MATGAAPAAGDMVGDGTRSGAAGAGRRTPGPPTGPGGASSRTGSRRNGCDLAGRSWTRAFFRAGAPAGRASRRAPVAVRRAASRADRRSARSMSGCPVVSPERRLRHSSLRSNTRAGAPRSSMHRASAVPESGPASAASSAATARPARTAGTTWAGTDGPSPGMNSG
ncbi:hypothetical protein GCM10009678_09970 [Actinomadura kijaniata]|uniref:hypothetical protein n=1 Tax=Actinomadura kijaniata TaxID=46161 RepID=UPI002FECE0E8